MTGDRWENNHSKVHTEGAESNTCLAGSEESCCNLGT